MCCTTFTKEQSINLPNNTATEFEKFTTCDSLEYLKTMYVYGPANDSLMLIDLLGAKPVAPPPLADIKL